MAIIDCSCNVITNEAVQRSIERNAKKLKLAETLLDAVGIVYRDARDTESRLLPEPKIPSCTGCFGGVAEDIKTKTGLFAGEALPAKTFEPTCARHAMTLGPRTANSNVMEHCAGGSCVSGPAVATL